MYNTIIIGAGASGLMSAIISVRKGEKVLLIEKMPQPALKLRITGKGRCNLTNTLPLKDFLKHCGSEPRFLYPAFTQFFHNELITFFEDLGLITIEERGGRIFPKSGKAQDVFLAMINYLEESNCTILKQTQVTKLIIEESQIKGVETISFETSNKELCNHERHKAIPLQKSYYSNKVILAAGGESYPQTGSSGDGIRLAKQAQHSIIETCPSLVGLKLKDYNPITEYPNLIDFELHNLRAIIKDKTGKKLCEEFGDIIFRENAIEGPIILTLSRQIASLAGKEKLLLELDLKPNIEQKTLDKKLLMEFDQRGKENIKTSLRAFLPYELIALAQAKCDIDFNKPTHQLSSSERKLILHFLKNCNFEIIGTLGFERAVVTQGGVNLKEINPKTLESKLTKGLYFAGEVMDLDADTGGFNLQIAFSTGYLAAQN
jgi:hypothetical protein